MRLSRLEAFAVLLAALIAGCSATYADAYVPVGQAPGLDGDISWDVYLLDTPEEADSACLFFERRDANTYRALKLAGGAIFLLKREGGVESFLGTGVPFDSFPGDHHTLLVRRRGTTLSVIVDGARLLGATDPAGPQPGSFGYQIESGAEGPWLSASGVRWTHAPEIRFERCCSLEDRMPGGWDVVSGEWRLKPTPGRAEGVSPLERYKGSEGLALAGDAAWDSYVARVAVQMAGGDSSAKGAGLAFYSPSPDDYFLLRLVNDGRTDAPSRLELVKVQDGEESVLKGRPVPASPGQWYELKVAVADDVVKAYVDGQFAFLAHDDGLAGGRVGLWAQGADGSRFDDLAVRGLRVGRADFLEDRDGREAQLQPASQALRDARLGLASHNDWRRVESPDGVLFENTNDYYGNVGLQWEQRRPMAADGSVTMTICADENELNSSKGIIWPVAV